jgi:hypothetical protein
MHSTALRISGLLLVVSFFNCCGVGKHSNKDEIINPEKVAFVEFSQTQQGEVISGKAPTGKRIDGPTYRYNKEQKQLTILRKESVAVDTLRAIIGYTRVLKGTAGNGVSSLINPIYKFPSSISKLTLSNVTNRGIFIVFDLKKLFLKDGDDWQLSTSKIDTLKQDPIVIVKNTTTYTIRYHGLINKKDIIY